MKSLQERDMRAVLDLVGDAHDAQDREEFRAVLLPGFQRLVPTDFTSYNEVLADGGTLAAIVEPDVPAWAHALWQRHALENPLVDHFMRTRDGRPNRFTDVTTRERLRRTTLYREVYRPLGIEHQLAFSLPSAPTLTVGIALSRGGRNFTERDRRVVDLTRPHLIQAYRNAELRERLSGLLDGLRKGLDADGAAVIVLDDDDTVAFASASARTLVDGLGAGALSEGRPLPEPLAAWAAKGPPTAGLPVAGRNDSLLVRRVSAGASGRVVLLERAARVLSPEALAGLGLTPREAEVLHGLARGIVPAALAGDLGVSPRTVAKHVERIHAKLGVRTRAQAVATAWAAASGA
jgi:DNA-binding CsgD family transcriptional regulator